MQKFIKAILHFLYLIVYRPKFIGKENIKENKPYIMCPNHVGTMDAAGLVLFNKRKIVFIVKEELYKHKAIKWLAELFGMIPVKRNAKDVGSMKNALKVLKENEILGIFPEGTRKGMAKKTPIKNGAAYLAYKTGVEVLPVGIKGNFRPFTQPVFNIGKPLNFNNIDKTKSEKEQLLEITNEIMDNIIRLTNEKI